VISGAQRLFFLRNCSNDAREAMMAWLVCSVTDKEWADCVDYGVRCGQDLARVRRQLEMELETRQDVADWGE
jgi:hypothetical protein